MTLCIGEALPDLTLPEIDGGTIALRQLRGRRRLIFFWGSW